MRKLLIALLVSMAALASAVPVSQINTVSVPVADRGQQNFNQALNQAFNDILIKVSGNPGVTTLPQVETNISRAKQFIESYDYQKVDDGNGNAELMLQVTFDQSAIRKILSHVNQPIWSANRPQVLVWMNIVDNQTGVLSDSNQGQFKVALDQAANMRGVPVVLPEMDIQDQGYTSLDPAQPDDNALMQIAKRYATDGVLVAKIQPDFDQQWQGQWLLWINDTPYQWQDDADSVSAVIGKGVNEAANQLANQFATINDQRVQAALTIAVMGIHSLPDYAKLVKLMRQQPLVRHLATQEIGDQDVLLQIQTTATSDQLEQSLEKIPGLTLLSQAPANNVQADLYFQYANANAPAANANNANASAQSSLW